MSEHEALVERLTDIHPHGNADSLEVAQVGGWTCCVRIGDFKVGDLAVFIEPDTVVRVEQPEFSFLAADAKNGQVRIKAKRLRGVPSFGLLIHARPGWFDGQNVWYELGLEHYDPPIHGANMGGEDASGPAVYHVKYDIESLRKHSRMLAEGEEVEITEKIHGANSRFVFHDGVLNVGSHTRWKKESETNLWWRAANAYHLAKVLADYPDHVVYGEVYGQVQDLKYGTSPNEVRLAVFDVMKDGKWLDVDAVHKICNVCGLDYVPILYRGPWSADCYKHADGRTTIAGADHVREGCVVKPTMPRWDEHLGRVILKLVSVDYLGRKTK
ncbi:MAG: RNA ligase (ATP) [Acidobacteriia bacterium]|nr:RNA ligase (ATP) [Terriglobia bacterium]